MPTGRRQYRREIERLFVPAWHLVGTSAELPRDGDFLTLDLLGEPVLVRNCSGNTTPSRTFAPTGIAC